MSRYSGIMQTVYTTVKKHHMLAYDEGVVVALSGGPDSVFLLHACMFLKETYRLQLYAVHIHHGARKEADDDAAFCEDLCHSMDIPFIRYHFNVPETAREQKISFEEAGRIVRRRAYQDAMAHFKAQRVATGHTADDQAETILMRVITGTGPAGLGGIPPVSGGFLIRPLLETAKRDILGYLEAHHLPYRVDHTNTDTTILRNRVRHLLIPFIHEHFNPRLEDALARTAEIFHEESNFITGLILPYLNLTRQGETWHLPLPPAGAIPSFAFPFLIREALATIRGEYKNITFPHIQSVVQLLDKPTGSSAQLPGGLQAVREEQNLVFRPMDAEEPAPLPSCPVKLPGEQVVPQWNLVVTGEILPEKPVSLMSPPTVAYMDADKVSPGTFVIRSRRDGDGFRPLGMNNWKKLQDFFIDEKIPHNRRDLVPLLENDGKILWVAGLRLSQDCRVDETTKRVLMVRIEHLEGDDHV